MKDKPNESFKLLRDFKLPYPFLVLTRVENINDGIIRITRGKVPTGGINPTDFIRKSDIFRNKDLRISSITFAENVFWMMLCPTYPHHLKENSFSPQGLFLESYWSL